MEVVRIVRPVGVTVLALSCGVVAAAFAAHALVFAFVPGALESSGFIPDPEVWRRILGLGFFGMVALLAGSLGVALYRLQPWGRNYLMAGCWWWIALTGFAVIGEADSNIPLRVLTVISILSAAAIAYLWLPSVRQVFYAERRLKRGVRRDGA